MYVCSLVSPLCSHVGAEIVWACLGAHGGGGSYINTYSKFPRFLSLFGLVGCFLYRATRVAQLII